MNRQDYGDGGYRQAMYSAGQGRRSGSDYGRGMQERGAGRGYESTYRTGEIVQGGGYAQRDFSQAGGYGPGRQGIGERYGGHQPDYGYLSDEGWVQSPVMEEIEYNEGLWEMPYPDSQEGPFRGRGPRDYQRSDQRIREDVCDMLTHHGHLDAADMEVEVSNGEVTLKGEVADRRQKRFAEDIAESVRGVKDVHNQLRVAWRQ